MRRRLTSGEVAAALAEAGASNARLDAPLRKSDDLYIELVTGLSEAIPDKVRITLIDKSDAFMFGFSKLDVMFGRRQASEVWNPYRGIDKPGVEFRHRE